MTGAAVQANVESTERPTGIGMRERRLFLGIVAFRALVLPMAAGADSMNLLIGLLQIGRLLKIVAIGTVFFLMAIHTAKVE